MRLAALVLLQMLFQSRHLLVTLLRDLLDALVIFHNPFAQRLDCSQQRLQDRVRFRTSSFTFSGFMFRGLQPRNRSPQGFVTPRTVLINDVRARTKPARARIAIRSDCACALRCFTGDNNRGSIRTSRASADLQEIPDVRYRTAGKKILACPPAA
jgi:hypothetical protein